MEREPASLMAAAPILPAQMRLAKCGDCVYYVSLRTMRQCAWCGVSLCAICQDGYVGMVLCARCAAQLAARR